MKFSPENILKVAGLWDVSVPLRGLWFEILVLGSLISCGFAVRFAARICFLPIFYVAWLGKCPSSLAVAGAAGISPIV